MADINFFRFPTRCPRYIRDTKGVRARTPYSVLTLCACVCVCIPSGAHMRSINYADSVMQTALLPRCFLCDASFVLFLLLSPSSRDCPSRSYRPLLHTSVLRPISSVYRFSPCALPPILTPHLRRMQSSLATQTTSKLSP